MEQLFNLLFSVGQHPSSFTKKSSRWIPRRQHGNTFLQMFKIVLPNYICYRYLSAWFQLLPCRICTRYYVVYNAVKKKKKIVVCCLLKCFSFLHSEIIIKSIYDRMVHQEDLQGSRFLAAPHRDHQAEHWKGHPVKAAHRKGNSFQYLIPSVGSLTRSL